MIELDKYKGSFPWVDAIIKELEELRAALVYKTKRSSYKWSEGGGYLPGDILNEGEIKCAEEILAKYSGQGKIDERV